MSTAVGVRTAKHLMKTDVVTVPRGTTLRDAARLLEEEHVHGAPVIDPSGAVLGVVSGTDLAAAITEETVSHAPRPTVAYGGAESVPWAEVDPDDTVENVMSATVISAAPDTTAGALGALMARERVHRVLILEDGDLAGIVSATDLLPCLAEYETALEVSDV